jgi:hypothetical protein
MTARRPRFAAAKAAMAAVACPRCKARPGEPCTTPEGYVCTIHIARVHAHEEHCA